MGAVAGLFPAYVEADCRRAAEAALKGAGLETLVSETPDGVRIEPVYRPAKGPRSPLELTLLVVRSLTKSRQPYCNSQAT